MGLFQKYINQTRKPEGFLGELMLRGMNSGHSALSDWGMSHLPERSFETAVELGCGGGRNIEALLKRYGNLHVTGVDYSSLSVEKAGSFNRRMIAAGRCTVQQGDVSNLTLPPEQYDLATAFETVYFWPNLEQCFSQVFRVLKPGGLFLICNESDGTDAVSLRFQKMIDGMKLYMAQELEQTLEEAGFSQVEVRHHPKKPWLAVLAQKGRI